MGDRHVFGVRLFWDVTLMYTHVVDHCHSCNAVRRVYYDFFHYDGIALLSFIMCSLIVCGSTFVSLVPFKIFICADV